MLIRLAYSMENGIYLRLQALTKIRKLCQRWISFRHTFFSYVNKKGSSFASLKKYKISQMALNQMFLFLIIILSIFPNHFHYK